MQIHAYDQIETLLGQGTVGAELEQQAPKLETLLVAVGGGGLLGGIAAWFADGAGLRLLAVEPEAAPTLTHALAAGRPVDAPAGGIAADSLAPRRVGSLMFPLARKHVAAALLVEDDAIRRAQQELWRVLRIAAEPGGAAAFSALALGTVCARARRARGRRGVRRQHHRRRLHQVTRSRRCRRTPCPPRRSPRRSGRSLPPSNTTARSTSAARWHRIR